MTTTLKRLNREWDPFRFLFDDRSLFDDRGGAAVVPPVNVRDDKDKTVIEVAAPGLSKDSFRVEASGGVLTVRAEQTDGRESNDGYTRREFVRSSFTRSFTLPDGVDADSARAEYRDGVLTVELPKTDKRPKGRLIDIR